MTAMATMSTVPAVTEHVHRNKGDEDQCRERICRNPCHAAPPSSKVATTKQGCPRNGQGECRLLGDCERRPSRVQLVPSDVFVYGAPIHPE